MDNEKFLKRKDENERSIWKRNQLLEAFRHGQL